MMIRRLSAFAAATVLAGALRPSSAQASAVFETPMSSSPAVLAAAPAMFAADASTAALEVQAADRRDFDALRARFLAEARESYLDRTGRAPLPALAFPPRLAEEFAHDFAALKSLSGQAAFIEAGRGAETLPAYADMAVLVASRLGVKPPERALAVYRDRVRLSTQTLTAEQAQGSADLAAEVGQRTHKPRYLYLADVVPVHVPRLRIPAKKTASVSRRGRKAKRRRVRAAVAPPPEPQGPPKSVLDSIDWDRAEELASAAEEGAQGWYTASSRKRARREQRKRRGRCYEWVRKALQETGLWTDEYRAEVPLRGDWRRPRRAFSFAWAMNALETKEQKDPAEARKMPLSRLDLRVDPLVIGSVIVFDRNVCGFNSRSGHIEVVSSIEPLRASSYKFHDLKLPCLLGAADAGRVHVYVPRRMEPAPAVEAAAPRPPSPG